MARWRYIAERLTGNGTGEVLDLDLPFTGVAIEDVLSGINGFSANIDPRVARLVDSEGRPLLKKYQTALYAEQDGEIAGGWIVSDISTAGPSLSVEAVGFLGYFDEMPYTGSGAAYVEVDPAKILRDISTHVQSQPDGNIALEFAVPDTTVRIGQELEQVEFDTQSGPASFEAGPYKLTNYDTDNLLENITNLCEETPFEYREKHYWDGDIIRHRVDFGHPTLGARRDDLRFVVGENIFAKPSTTMAEWATDVIVLGAGTGPTIIRGESGHRTGGLRRPKIVTDNTIRSVKSARERAQAEWQALSARDDITEVRVANSNLAPRGSVKVGDEIYVRGRLDWLTLNMWVRVTSISYSPTEPDFYDLQVTRTDAL